jgi:hypothetical protein
MVANGPILGRNKLLVGNGIELMEISGIYRRKRKL